MLAELFQNLINATTIKEIDKAYSDLEAVGMDRVTALLIAHELLDKGEITREV